MLLMSGGGGYLLSGITVETDRSRQANSEEPAPKKQKVTEEPAAKKQKVTES